MKKIFILIVFVLSGITTKTNAQTQLNQFLGTWEYENGNQVFMVKFWEEEGMTKGRYKMITVDSSGNETGIIYNSKDKWGNSLNAPEYEILCSLAPDGSLTGLIHDTTINYTESDFITGHLSLELNSFNGQTANWMVTRSEGIKIEGEPDFNVPVDITLTKVSNDIYPD